MKANNVYLNFNGNCEKAFTFYRSVFGGEFIAMQRFKDIPSDVPFSAPKNEKIMHISLPMGSNVLMGCDVPDTMNPVTEGNNFNISVDTESKEEATQLFQALSSGGEVTMPLDHTFWGSYFGMCRDKFGIQWMVSFDTSKPE